MFRMCGIVRDTYARTTRMPDRKPQFFPVDSHTCPLLNSTKRKAHNTQKRGVVDRKARQDALTKISARHNTVLTLSEKYLPTRCIINSQESLII